MTTVEFCRSELDRYGVKLTGSALSGISLSCGSEADVFCERYVIDVNRGKGCIKANRPRALLLGVYDFLRRVGCRFLRPGENGEYVPKRTAAELNAKADVVPHSRHRGITIEGSVSVENVLGIIDWAPKAGFNSYFIQFRTAFEFFDRWYKKIGESVTETDCSQFVAEVVKQIRLRDMIYHAVGHGWTSACLGLEADGWQGSEVPLPQSKRRFLAEIDGERKLFNGVPLNTHLCYSNPEVRSMLASEVVSYAQAHPEIDVLHFWLADNFNNVCECSVCRSKRLADWYVMILNEIDALLTERGLNVKICFLVYLDLYWAPQTERIINQDRFIMMFAPIFRTYTTPYELSGEGVDLQYDCNKIEYPHDAATYLRFLSAWKEVFKGDSFDFDYHLMWDIYRDFGGEGVAEVLYRDIRSLDKMGLNGFMSCQIQRAFYPNGLAFYLMGRALSDGDISYEEIKKEYYSAAFGSAADFAEQLYRSIEQTVSFKYFKEEESTSSASAGLIKAQALLSCALDKFPVPDDGVRAESFEILKFAVGNILNFVHVINLQLGKAPECEIAAAEAERRRFFENGLMRFQPFVDEFYQNLIVGGLIEERKVGIYA